MCLSSSHLCVYKGTLSRPQALTGARKVKCPLIFCLPGHPHWLRLSCITSRTVKAVTICREINTSRLSQTKPPDSCYQHSLLCVIGLQSKHRDYATFSFSTLCTRWMGYKLSLQSSVTQI